MSALRPEAERRRRLLTRAIPLILIAGGAFALGLLVSKGSPELEAAKRFAAAWERGELGLMHGELTAAAAAEYPEEQFRSAYEQAASTSTLEEVSVGEVSGSDEVAGKEVVAVAISARTNAFGKVSGTVVLPVSESGIGWAPHLVFPGLQAGEELERNTRTPERAPILSEDGEALAEGAAEERSSPVGEAAADIVGTLGTPRREEREELREQGFPPGMLVGTSGLEQAFDTRLIGRPGGRLEAVGSEAGPRVIASSKPKPAKPVRTTIDADLQRAAVAALGELFGGIAVLDARKGSVRALSGIAFSAPQPPGSTFKVLTTVAALEEDVVSPDEEFPVVTEATVGGRTISNAHDEACGGTFVDSFAASCNSVFAPLGIEVGAEKLVETAEEFGFNAPPALFGPEAMEEISPPASTIPNPIGSELDVAVSAIGQGQVLATPLQMATVAQAIANRGKRSPTPIASGGKLRPDADPVRVTDRATAATVRDLMVANVERGTGIAADIADAQVAGKTGTAELGPDPDAPAPAADADPVQRENAWFIAFAPASKPRLAIAVMVVDALGGGGEIAAPIAAEVLSAGL